MDYAARLQVIGNEYNAILAQIQQPMGRLSFLQGQIDIIVALQAEDEASKKAVADKLAQSNGNATEPMSPAVEWVPGTQTGSN